MTVMYVIWSNKQNAWWGPGGRYYTQDLWEAGRFILEDSERLCRIRTWAPNSLPPEVAVQAPEMTMRLDTYEAIEAAPELTRRLVEECTRVALRERAMTR